MKAAIVSILLYRCTTWTLTKRLEKKLDGNYTRMLRAVLNNSWRQRPTKQRLYSHLPPITKTIKVRLTRQPGHCRRSREELIMDVLLSTPSHGRAKVGRPARTYILKLWGPSGSDERYWGWREKAGDIRADGPTTWGYIYICVCVCVFTCVRF